MTRNSVDDAQPVRAEAKRPSTSTEELSPFLDSSDEGGEHTDHYIEDVKLRSEDELDIDEEHEVHGGPLYGLKPRWEQSNKRRRWVIPLATLSVVSLGVLAAFVTLARLGHRPSKRPALVVASYRHQDVAWLADVPNHWDVFRYCTDCGRGQKTFVDKFGTSLSVPSSIGREAMAYLTYLIDHYDNPAPYTLFLHGHNTSWHQPESIPDILRALDLASVDAEGYIPLKCTVDTCIRESRLGDLTQGPSIFDDNPLAGATKYMPALWKAMFQSKEDDENLHKPLPSKHSAVGGAQFAVSAAAVRSVPLALFKRLRKPMESKAALKRFDRLLRNITVETWGFWEGHDTLDTVFGGGWYSELTTYALGGLFELIWPDVFGKPPVFCPTIEVCREVYLSNAVKCKGWNKFKGGDQNVTCTIQEKALAKAVERNRILLDQLG